MLADHGAVPVLGRQLWRVVIAIELTIPLAIPTFVSLLTLSRSAELVLVDAFFNQLPFAPRSAELLQRPGRCCRQTRRKQGQVPRRPNQPITLFALSFDEDAHERRKHSTLLAASSSPLVACRVWHRSGGAGFIQSARAMGTPSLAKARVRPWPDESLRAPDTRCRAAIAK